jgi:hypothetical protein
MASLIVPGAVCLFMAGMVAGITGMVTVAIRREEKNLTLTSPATGPVIRAGRWVNGVHVRAPRRPWYTHQAGGDPGAR